MSREWTQEELASLRNFYDLSATTCSDSTEFQRRMWAAKEFSKSYDVDAPLAYIKLCKEVGDPSLWQSDSEV